MTWDGNAVSWRGRPSYQLPSDLIEYQRIVYETRPATIFETGGGGGTTRFLRDLRMGQVVAVDADMDSIDRDTVAWARTFPHPRMVLLDSNVYSVDHVAREIGLWSPIVSRGQYLVVCKTYRDDWGARKALHTWDQEGFTVMPDPAPTLNPGGFLLRDE